MTDEPDLSLVPDVAELVEDLKRRVAERRRTGDYPTELITELRAHFERVRRHRPVTDLEYLAAQLDALDALGWFSADKIVLDSPRPGARTAHSLVARAVARQTHGILDQVQLFGDAVREALRTVLAALEEPRGHVHDDLLGQLETLHDEVAELRRGPDDATGALASVRARLEAVEAAIAGGRFPSPFERRHLEALRTTADDDRLRALAREFEPTAPVLDIGGAESFASALKEVGVEVLSVEADQAVAHLLTLSGAGLGGVALVVGAEGLSVQEVATIVSLSFDKVRPGGRVVVGTTPLHPAYLRLLFEEAGFAGVEVRADAAGPERAVLVAVR
ncbi:MAG TPA: hypothetical protein VHF47_07355 [Acidimicrobiales bacterium]|nr:hypothetical protein [Acidimicrobiales bacterium]